MTPVPKEKSKTNYYHIPTWLTLGTFLMVAGYIWKAGSIETEFRDGIMNNSKMIREHKTDYNVHMPLSQKYQIFIPRTELDTKFESVKEQNVDIKKQLNRIEAKLDKQ